MEYMVFLEPFSGINPKYFKDLSLSLDPFLFLSRVLFICMCMFIWTNILLDRLQVELNIALNGGGTGITQIAWADPTQVPLKTNSRADSN